MLKPLNFKRSLSIIFHGAPALNHFLEWGSKESRRQAGRGMSSSLLGSPFTSRRGNNDMDQPSRASGFLPGLQGTKEKLCPRAGLRHLQGYWLGWVRASNSATVKGGGTAPLWMMEGGVPALSWPRQLSQHNHLKLLISQVLGMCVGKWADVSIHCLIHSLQLCPREQAARCV